MSQFPSRAKVSTIALLLVCASGLVRRSHAQEDAPEHAGAPAASEEPTAGKAASADATRAQRKTQPASGALAADDAALLTDEPTPTEEPLVKRPYTRWKLPAAGDSQSGDPEIILTFDDGPHERYTAIVLDELAKRNIKAIFFWVGRRVTGRSPKLAQRLALVRRAVREGHIVATHGVEHLHMCTVPKRVAESELDRSDAAYRELTGLPMVFFRTPYGSHCKRLVRMLRERNLEHLHWDIDPMEWTDHDSGRVAATLTQKLRRLRGRAVVLMHDTQLVTAKALPKALDFIAAENQRRRERGGRPIRILTGSDLATERLDPSLAAWTHDSVAAARARLASALGSLVP